MPLSHAPSKQEPLWFGPSFFGQSTFGQATTRNIVGVSVESSIPFGHHREIGKPLADG